LTAIAGIMMIVPLYFAAFLDVNFKTDLVDSNNFLWTLHNNSFYVIILAGIVFIMELRREKKTKK
jgi:hypothetical protein